jgi:hypothetical protein
MSDEQKQPESVIAPSTTLIIGKNNAGKTTVVNALKMLCHNEQPSASDFNLSYLHGLFKQYKQAFVKDNNKNFEDLETPNLEFTLMVKVNFNEHDLMAHISPFIPISEDGNGKPVGVCIKTNIALTEESAFKEEVSKIFDNKLEDNLRFEKFYALLSKETSVIQTENNLYQTTFIDSNEKATEKFSLKQLINIKEIKANRHLKEGVLTNVFNKIIAFQLTNDLGSRSDLEKSIESINKQISGNVSSKSTGISQVLSEVESTNKVNLDLSGNVTYDAMMKGLIKYNFMDGEDYIPEDQFGLGYINLLNIIGEIIHFVDSYEEKSHFSRINLLFIEEPEAFMHPQMQEFFIKRIDNAVKKAIKIASASSCEEKTLQCQIVITTHSSHIVNSKIQTSNSFNNLNYLTSINKCTKAINLTDEVLVSSKESNADDIRNFIKKHIKYKVSELFFSDAVIFVEGITEETLLNFFLEKHPILSRYYISVFNINGAHGKLYLPLAKKLSVPSLIVTDLDIKRAKCEKGERHEKSKSCDICGQQEEVGDNPFIEGSEPKYAQITSLKGRTTTNTTLKEFNEQLRHKSADDANKLDDIDFFQNENIYVVFQKEPINNQHATSLEEALILTNYDNDIINHVIQICKPDIYKDILNLGGKENRENLIYHSYKLQKKLSDSKSDFSNELIFGLLSSEDNSNFLQLPNYLNSGLDWLVTKLQTNDIPSSSEADVAVEVEAESTTIEGAEATSDDSE